MADKTLNYELQITNANGNLGSIAIHAEDGVITGARLKIADVALKQADFAAIQAAYNELVTFATKNNLTWETPA
jgi:hypothetical protein